MIGSLLRPALHILAAGYRFHYEAQKIPAVPALPQNALIHLGANRRVHGEILTLLPLGEQFPPVPGAGQVAGTRHQTTEGAGLFVVQRESTRGQQRMVQQRGAGTRTTDDKDWTLAPRHVGHLGLVLERRQRSDGVHYYFLASITDYRRFRITSRYRPGHFGL